MTPPVTDRGEWFGAARAQAWAAILAAMSALMLLGLLIGTRGGSAADFWGRPLAPDFSSFWTAARMALGGAATSVWEPTHHEAAERVLFPVQTGYRADYYGFFYPPSFLLLLLPFGLLPYWAAGAAWVLATGVAYLASLRRLLPIGWPVLLTALAFPAVLVNATHGQNGALSAALLAGGAGLLERRPFLAGLCLGALSVKPQLVLLVAPALAAARRWRALAGAGLSAASLAGGAWLAFGGGAWRAFLANGIFAVVALEDGLVGHAKMVSVFAGARLLGMGVDAAWAVQAGVSLLVATIVVATVRWRPGGIAEMSIVGAAACLMTPFVLDYDLMIIAVPLAWLACRTNGIVFRRGEKPTLLAAFALPLLARPVATHLDLPIVPGVLAGLLWVVMSRSLAEVQPGERHAHR